MPAPHPTFSVDVNDETGENSGVIDGLTASAYRAASAWGEYLVGYSNLDIEINIGSSVINTADGSSGSVVGIASDGSRSVEIGSAPYELRSGQDPDGNGPNIVINISPEFISRYLWLDPDPGNDSLPSNKINADETFEHEIGHALGFNGYRDVNTTSLGSYESTFDKYLSFDGNHASFDGPSAEAAYGGPVPLTYAPGDPENFYHYANSGGPGSDLISGLMSGVGHYLGTEAYISPLDIAMLSDAGCPIGLPERGTGGADDIVGGDLPVVADLRRGNDIFHGGSGSDFVYGGSGDDVLYGGAGDDFLSGGPGSNVLVGNEGADTFAVRVAGAFDRVMDFNPSEGDMLRIINQSYTFGTAADGSLMLDFSGGGNMILEGFSPLRQNEVHIDHRSI